MSESGSKEGEEERRDGECVFGGDSCQFSDSEGNM